MDGGVGTAVVTLNVADSLVTVPFLPMTTTSKAALAGHFYQFVYGLYYTGTLEVGCAPRCFIKWKKK